MRFLSRFVIGYSFTFSVSSLDCLMTVVPSQ